MVNSTQNTNNRRIAKNTVFLYLRMLVSMVVGLYTSRVILNSLGIEDYGLYNVVGGVVAMFSLFTTSLSTAISRFLTYSLGKGNRENLSRVFSTSVSIQFFMALIISFLIEIVGYYVLTNYLNIPDGRFDAAKWVFHLAVITFAINLISVPYNAAIIAHERMSAYAFINIAETFLKMFVAYLICISPIDKLVFFGIMLTLIAVLIRLVYGIYCRRNFIECKYKFILDKSLLKEMSGFAGWNLLGSGAYLFNTQGVNIITNIFFGVGSNAARGIALQVENAARQLATNFATAINPQITKSYAGGNLEYMHSLVCKGAKFSYLLMLVLVMPFLFEAETILKLWLKTCPPEAPLFLRISFVGTLFDVLGNSTANAAWATGNIKRYYIIIGGVGSLVFPISLVCFLLGCPAFASYIVFAVIYCILVFLKVYIIKDLVSFSPKMFYKEVLLKILPTTAVATIFPMLAYVLMSDSLLKSIVVIFLSIISVCLAILVFGLTQGERNEALLILRKRFHVCQ